MHTLRMTILGLVVLAAFVVGAWIINRSQKTRIDGARSFVWVWLVAAVANLLVGVFAAGVPLLTEIAVLLVVFGVPALAAIVLSRRFGPRASSWPDS